MAQSMAILEYNATTKEMDVTQCSTTTDPASGAWDAYPVPPASVKNVIARPGNLDLNGTKYVVPEGLLSVFQSGASSGYRIAVATSNPDPYKFIGAIASLICYGTEDNALSIANQKLAMRSRRILLTCTAASDLTISFLQAEGFTARRVHFVTLDTPTNYDDGHVCVEVQIGGEWKLFDVANNCYYTDGSDHLSLQDLLILGETNATKVNISTPNFSHGFSTAGFNPVCYFDQYQATQDLRDDWSARVLQAGGIVNGAEIWFRENGMSAGEKTQVEGFSASYKVKSNAVFDAQFYP